MIKGIIASVEAYEAREGIDTTDVTGDSDISVTDVVDNARLETELLDVQEQEHEYEGMERDLDDAEDAMQSLEALVESLEYVKKHDTFNKSVAAMYNHAKESIYARLGMECREENFVSLESLPEKGPSSIAVAAALEAEQSALRKVWEAVKKFVIQMYNSVVKFIAGLFGSAESLARRAKQVANITEFTPGYTLTDDEKKRYGKSFSADGAVLGLLLTSEELLKFFNEKLLTNIGKATIEVMDAAATHATLVASGKEILGSEARVENSALRLKSFMLEFEDNEFVKKEAGEGWTFVKASRPLPGGYGFRLYGTMGEKENIAKYSFGRVEEEANNAVFPEKGLPKDLAEAKKIASNILRLAAVIRNNQKALKDMVDKAKNIIDKMKVVGVNEGEEKAKLEAELRKDAKNMRDMFKSLSSVSTACANYEIKKSKEILDLVVKAAKGPGKQAETKEAEKTA